MLNKGKTLHSFSGSKYYKTSINKILSL